MSESKHIQDPKTGKMLGSIGEGKDNVPTPKQDISIVSDVDSVNKPTGSFDTEALLVSVLSAKETLETAAALGAKIPAIVGSTFYEVRVFNKYREDFDDYESLGFYASKELAEEGLATWIMDAWHKGRSGAYSPWTSKKYDEDHETPEWHSKAADFAKNHSSLEIISFYFDIPGNRDKYILGEDMYNMSNFNDKYEIVEDKISRPEQKSSTKWEISKGL